MLAAFLETNTKNSGIQSVQADKIGRTYPPLFTINLLKEEEILDDLKEISAMEYVVQVIMIIVCIAVVIIIMYFCCTKCRHAHTIFKYCFPFLPTSCIVHMSCHTDLFVEVTNITKGNSIWAHFTMTGCFPLQIRISRPIRKEDVQIATFCCIFKCMRANWPNIIVTGISGMTIVMPEIAKVSIFMDNELTNITDGHFKIKLIARLLDQIYVVRYCGDSRFASHRDDFYYFGCIVDFVVLLVYYLVCVDRSGSLSGSAFNQLKLVTLSIVLTILYLLKTVLQRSLLQCLDSLYKSDKVF